MQPLLLPEEVLRLEPEEQPASSVELARAVSVTGDLNNVEFIRQRMDEAVLG